MVRMVCVHLDYYARLTFVQQFSHLLKDEDGRWFVNNLYGLHKFLLIVIEAMMILIRILIN